MKKLLSATFAAVSLATLAVPVADAAGGKRALRNITEIRYDVDLKTGVCTRSSVYLGGEDPPVVLPVPCDEYVFEFIPAEKKPEYLRKFGAPKK